jgi:5-methylcytosine-specific restriction protein A
MTKRSWNVTRKPQENRTFQNPWYHTQAWRKLRASVLADNPLCVHCQKDGITTLANVCDHIKNVASGKTAEERERLMWDRNNLQGLCTQCHNKKSAKEKR